MMDTTWHTRRVRAGVAAGTALALAASTGIAAAESPGSRPGPSQRVQLEDPDRGRTLIATITESTNYLDAAGDGSATYRVAAVVNGREQRRSRALSPSAQSCRDLPLQKPADGVTPTGEAYTYAANDMRSDVLRR